MKVKPSFKPLTLRLLSGSIPCVKITLSCLGPNFTWQKTQNVTVVDKSYISRQWEFCLSIDRTDMFGYSPSQLLCSFSIFWTSILSHIYNTRFSKLLTAGIKEQQEHLLQGCEPITIGFNQVLLDKWLHTNISSKFLPTICNTREICNDSF